MLRYLLEKEFKRILRDRFLPKIILLVPVIQLLILPLAANFEMTGIRIVMVDHDRSELSRQLVEKIGSSGYFNLIAWDDDYNQALAQIETDKADIIVEIPNRFESLIMRSEPVDLFIAANAVNGTKGGVGVSYLSTIVTDWNRSRLIESGGVSQTPMAEIRVKHQFNPHLSYKNYMVPGIMVFLLTIIGGFLSALNIVSEKEQGTIEQMNVTPLPKSLFLLSKLIPFWIIGLILLTIGMLIGWIVYGLVPQGSIGVIYLFGTIYLIAFTGIGLAISALSSTQQQAMFTAFFILIILALLSGLFTPISSMPEWAQQITLFNPMRYFIEVMRSVYLKGSTMTDLAPYFGIITLFAVVFNLFALTVYRKYS